MACSRCPRATRVLGLTSPGLGMFAAAQLIEAMGGDVWARSREDAVEIGFDLPGYELSA